MHIVDGALSMPVIAVTSAAAAAGVGIGLRKIDLDRIPHVAVMSSVFFVGSLIHVPVGPSSVHLILNGLMGVVLGWAAFPALLIALLLQAVFFGFGGLTVLGTNAFNIAAPALLCYFLFAKNMSLVNRRRTVIFAGIAGFSAILMSACLVALTLIASGKEFLATAYLVIGSHIPVMILEGFLTATAVAFLLKVKPEVLGIQPTVESHSDELEENSLGDSAQPVASGTK